MITARTAETAVIATEKDRIVAFPGLRLDEDLDQLLHPVEEPDTPAKKIDSTTLIWASPPGKCPTIVRERRSSRSVMPPMFIRFMVSRKNGTASRMNEL